MRASPAARRSVPEECTDVNKTVNAVRCCADDLCFDDSPTGEQPNTEVCPSVIGCTEAAVFADANMAVRKYSGFCSLDMRPEALHDFSDSIAHCEVFGARLCTIAELKASRYANGSSGAKSLVLANTSSSYTWTHGSSGGGGGGSGSGSGSSGSSTGGSSSCGEGRSHAANSDWTSVQCMARSTKAKAACCVEKSIRIDPCHSVQALNAGDVPQTIDFYKAEARNLKKCRWSFSCPAGKAVSLTFSKFSTEAYTDFVRVEQQSVSTGVAVELLRLHGSNVVPSGKTRTVLTDANHTLLLYFESDNAVDSMGFRAEYSCAAATSKTATHEVCRDKQAQNFNRSGTLGHPCKYADATTSCHSTGCPTGFVCTSFTKQRGWYFTPRGVPALRYPHEWASHECACALLPGSGASSRTCESNMNVKGFVQYVASKYNQSTSANPPALRLYVAGTSAPQQTLTLQKAQRVVIHGVPRNDSRCEALAADVRRYCYKDQSGYSAATARQPPSRRPSPVTITF